MFRTENFTNEVTCSAKYGTNGKHEVTPLPCRKFTKAADGASQGCNPLQFVRYQIRFNTLKKYKYMPDMNYDTVI